ncbi:MAG: fatty acid desaturase family protein [Acidimicrobiales bacterium]
MSRPPTFPGLGELGGDLLNVSRSRRAGVLARPLLMMATYGTFATLGWWIPAMLVLVALFPVMVAVIHDLLHRSLGLSAAANRRWLSVLAVGVLQSGHAIQATHLEHHRRFPNQEDPEVYVAAMGLGRALLEGPIYPYRLWSWARHHRPALLGRTAAEAAGHGALGLGSVALLPVTAVPFMYAATMFVGCSLFPAISVNLLHRSTTEDPLAATRTVRGVLLPLLTLGSGYHLEHHLYPRVPSPNYSRLARRLRPLLDGQGVRGFTLTPARSNGTPSGEDPPDSSPYRSTVRGSPPPPQRFGRPRQHSRLNREPLRRRWCSWGQGEHRHDH